MVEIRSVMRHQLRDRPRFWGYKNSFRADDDSEREIQTQ